MYPLTWLSYIWSFLRFGGGFLNFHEQPHVHAVGNKAWKASSFHQSETYRYVTIMCTYYLALIMSFQKKYPVPNVHFLSLHHYSIL